MKSVKQRLIVFTILMLLLVSMALGISSYLNASRALMTNVEKTFPKIAEQSARYVEAKVEDILHGMETITSYAYIRDPNKPLSEKLSLLQEELARNGYKKMGIVNIEGNAVYTDGSIENIKDQEYFKRAKTGISNVSDPLVSEDNKTLLVVYAAPIKEGSTVTGALIAAVDGNFLSTITNEIAFGSTGKAFMISRNGTTIADSDP